MNKYGLLAERHNEGDFYEDQDLGWANNIKMVVREIDGSVMNWFDLARDRNRWRALVRTVMKLRVP
jgi:hypothetical protein